MAMKKARILVDTPIDGIDYQPNQVIEADAELIRDLEKAGFVDSKKAAVDYCIKEEGEEVITHASPSEELEEEDSAGDGESGAEGGSAEGGELVDETGEQGAEPEA